MPNGLRPTQRQYWSKIRNMRDVANRTTPDSRAARTRLYQITRNDKFFTKPKLSTKDVRMAYRELRKIQKLTYKAQKALMPNAKTDYLWAQVQRITEEEDTDWNPYPEGEEEGED